MSQTEEKFRISFSIEELDWISFKLQEDPEVLMEKLDMFQRVEKLRKKVQAGVTGAAFLSSGSASMKRIGTLTVQLQQDRAIGLIEQQEVGKILSQEELEAVVTYKADNKLHLTEEEQQVFNMLLMKKMGL